MWRSECHFTTSFFLALCLLTRNKVVEKVCRILMSNIWDWQKIWRPFIWFGFQSPVFWLRDQKSKIRRTKCFEIQSLKRPSLTTAAVWVIGMKETFLLNIIQNFLTVVQIVRRVYVELSTLKSVHCNVFNHRKGFCSSLCAWIVMFHRMLPVFKHRHLCWFLWVLLCTDLHLCNAMSHKTPI